MSWLKGLAGKAEDLLNQIDQNAAVAFHTTKEKDYNKKGDILTEVTWERRPSPGFDVVMDSKELIEYNKASSSSSSQRSDEDLPNFVTAESGSVTHVLLPEGEHVSLRHSPLPGGPGIVLSGFPHLGREDLMSRRQFADQPNTEQTITEDKQSGKLSTHFTKPAGPESLSTSFVAESPSGVTLTGVLEDPGAAVNMSDSANENKLLRNELRSANTEICSLRQRAKTAEKLCEELQERISRLENTSRTSVLEEEIAVARERAQASEELAVLWQKEKEKCAKMEEEFQVLCTGREALEKQLSVCKEESNQLSDKCEKLLKERKHTNVELERYRTRAQRVLQEKDRLIEELRAGSSTSGLASSLDDPVVERLNQEKELFREENAQISAQLQAVREELDVLEKRYSTHREQAGKSNELLQSEVQQEKKRRLAVEEDASHLAEELRAVQEEHSRQRSLLSKRVQERERELTKLRAQLAQRPASSSEEELEQRLHSLTQRLVQKQSMVETLTTERNALRLQLEKLEDRQRQTTAVLQQLQSRPPSLNDNDDGKSHVPSLFVETPFDSGISRRVKRAYSSLDAVSIRTGVFLRRYPLARILVFCYMIFLHLWVVFVLLEYSPQPL